MAYFLTDDSTPKGRDPNINIIDGIHKIKNRTSVKILVSNYTIKHLTFHKGEYIGHLKPAKPYPIAMKHYQWVKEEIEKLLATKVICTSCSSWSAPIIVVPKGNGGKCLVIDYRALKTK